MTLRRALFRSISHSEYPEWNKDGRNARLNALHECVTRERPRTEVSMLSTSAVTLFSTAREDPCDKWTLTSIEAEAKTG
jgi:hypothetical protein